MAVDVDFFATALWHEDRQNIAWSKSWPRREVPCCTQLTDIKSGPVSNAAPKNQGCKRPRGPNLNDRKRVLLNHIHFG